MASSSHASRRAAGRVFTALAAAALAAVTAGCAAPSSAGPAPELRLRRIILYQNGIGYFERTGALQEAKLRLRFREREVDDVLKSLVVVEEGRSITDDELWNMNYLVEGVVGTLPAE